MFLPSFLCHTVDGTQRAAHMQSLSGGVGMMIGLQQGSLTTCIGETCCRLCWGLSTYVKNDGAQCKVCRRCLSQIALAP